MNDDSVTKRQIASPMEYKSAFAEIAHEQLGTPADERELLACGACSNAGYAGEHPFSTAAFSGMCDDCL